MTPETMLVEARDLPATFGTLRTDANGVRRTSASATRVPHVGEQNIRVVFCGHRVWLAPSQRVRICK